MVHKLKVNRRSTLSVECEVKKKKTRYIVQYSTLQHTTAKYSTLSRVQGTQHCPQPQPTATEYTESTVQYRESTVHSPYIAYT